LLEADVKRLNILNGKLRAQLLAEREKREATIQSLVSSPATASPDKSRAASTRQLEGGNAMESSLRHANRQVARLQAQIQMLEQRDTHPEPVPDDGSGEKVGAFKQFGKRLKADLEAQIERRLQAERDLYEAQDRAAAEMHRLERKVEAQEERILHTEQLLAEADSTGMRRAAELDRVRAQLQSEMDARSEAEAQRDAITRLSLVQRNSTTEEERWQALASKAQASLVHLQQQLMHEKQVRVPCVRARSFPFLPTSLTSSLARVCVTVRACAHARDRACMFVCRAFRVSCVSCACARARARARTRARPHVHAHACACTCRGWGPLSGKGLD
jgi:hypothetical protein